MRKTAGLLLLCTLMSVSGLAFAQEPFDGNWLTTLKCPAKGKMESYTWQFPSVIQNSHFRGEHGTAGLPGYVLIEGQIAADGSAKLSAKGIASSRKYPQGEAYNYPIGAQFRAGEGNGSQRERLGIIRHTCTLEFVKQQPTGQAGGD